MGPFVWIVLVPFAAAFAGCILLALLNQRRSKQRQGSSAKEERQPFVSFMLGMIRLNPAVSVDEVVEAYIREHHLAVPRRPDEPALITMNRAKLQVLEQFVEEHPDYNRNDPHFQTYLTGLRMLVPVLDETPPEMLKHMREREGEKTMEA